MLLHTLEQTLEAVRSRRAPPSRLAILYDILLKTSQYTQRLCWCVLHIRLHVSCLYCHADPYFNCIVLCGHYIQDGRNVRAGKQSGFGALFALLSDSHRNRGRRRHPDSNRSLQFTG